MLYIKKLQALENSVLIFLSGFMLLFTSTATGQIADSVHVLTEEIYIDWVQKYHPIVRQVDLLERKTAAYELKAKGGFEPKLAADIQQKSFDGKTYYTIGQTGLKIPSWLGIEWKAGYNWTNGVFVNPENNLPGAGQAYAGFTWSLGRGLFFDKRRATLEKVKLLQAANEAERRQRINDLLLDASIAYWDWVTAYNQLEILKNALTLSKNRLIAIRSSFEQGDKPAIDTLETNIQVQNRRISLNDALLDYTNSSNTLSNFLWYENDLPLEISAALQPPLYADLPLEDLVIDIEEGMATITNQHPTLVQYKIKMQELEIERRFQKEQLKPKVDLSFNFLADGLDFVNTPKSIENNNAVQTLLTENYKVGISVGMPLAFRKERANLELLEVKLLETNLSILQKKQEIKNKVETYQNLLANTKQQTYLLQDNIKAYQQLLGAENEKFQFGESSIFLLNSREQKLIAAQLKLIKTQFYYQKNRLVLLWAIGESALSKR